MFSPGAEALKTTMPASGPKRTAAKTDGKSDIETVSVLPRSAILPRHSVTAAISARLISAAGAPGLHREHEGGRDRYRRRAHSHQINRDGTAQIGEFRADPAKNLHIPQKGYKVLLAVSPLITGEFKCVSS